MVEDLKPYNLEVKYVPGSQTEVADYGSRNPALQGSHELFASAPGPPGISMRSCRVMSLDCMDPKVQLLAKASSQDDLY